MFRRGQRTAVREAVNEKAEWLLSLVGASPREGAVLVAQIGEEVVGAALFRIVHGETELLALVTDPNHRHRGIGRKLVFEVSLRARANGCARVRVRIAKADDAALAFFRGLRFDETHVALDLAL
jgi:ribosomal protein S18 acetylase RimI-like enzyme